MQSAAVPAAASAPMIFLISGSLDQASPCGEAIDPACARADPDVRGQTAHMSASGVGRAAHLMAQRVASGQAGRLFFRRNAAKLCAIVRPGYSTARPAQIRRSNSSRSREVVTDCDRRWLRLARTCQPLGAVVILVFRPAARAGNSARRPAFTGGIKDAPLHLTRVLGMHPKPAGNARCRRREFDEAAAGPGCTIGEWGSPLDR